MKFYALRYDVNAKEVKHFNIFQNICFAEDVERKMKKYLADPEHYEYQDYHGIKSKSIYGEAAIRKDIDLSLKSEFWARVQYEMCIGDKFERNPDNLTNTDIYQQCAMNFDVLFDYILRSYKEELGC